MWKQRIITSLWCVLAIAVFALLTAAVQYKKNALCSGIKVNIEGAQNHVFIDEKNIADIMKKNGAAIEKPIADIPLQAIENAVRREPWIKDAQLFFDNNHVLNASIQEREPLARIFTVQGASFYIDSSGMQLPLSSDYSARVPVFTGFTSGKKNLSAPDSLLLNDVKKIATFIQQDSFWTAQVAQINITPHRTFEIVPVVGNQIIELGNADSLESKFYRLNAFYKQVWATAGFEKYETISVQYNGQIVAVKRGLPKPSIDTALAVKFINAMRNGSDIVKDTSKIITQNTNTFTASVLDTTAHQNTKQSVLIKKILLNKSAHIKPLHSAKTKFKTSKNNIQKK